VSEASPEPKGGNQTRVRLPARALGLVLVALVARPAGAQELSPAASEGVVAMWQQNLGEIEKLLVEREWKRAKRKADGLLDAIVERLRSGTGSGPLLGSAVAMRAVARAGLGEFEAAAWDWHVAVALSPAVQEVDLSRFGEPGRFFGSSEIAAYSVEGGAAVPLDLREPLVPIVADGKGPEPVRKIHAPQPGYPRAKAAACSEEPIALHFVVAKSGRPIAPVFSGSADPVLAFSALETVREWRFEPATLDGEPVEALYNLLVNYRLTYCPDPRASGR